MALHDHRTSRSYQAVFHPRRDRSLICQCHTKRPRACLHEFPAGSAQYSVPASRAEQKQVARLRFADTADNRAFHRSRKLPPEKPTGKASSVCLRQNWTSAPLPHAEAAASETHPDALPEFRSLKVHRDPTNARTSKLYRNPCATQVAQKIRCSSARLITFSSSAARAIVGLIVEQGM